MTDQPIDRRTPWLAGYCLALGLNSDGVLSHIALPLGLLLTIYVVLGWMNERHARIR